MSFDDIGGANTSTSFGLVWEVATLSWVKATQASGAAGGGDASAANQVTGNASLASIDGKTPALGQALAAASSPVVLTAIQVAALTPPAAITGFALDATLTGRTQKSQITDGTRDGTVKAASTLPLATDTAVVTTQRDALPTGTNSIGGVTANAGTNLNTSALNLETTQTAMSAKLPATLGQKAMATSMAVVLASDQSAVPVTGPTLTKGTQGATGFSTQDLKDAGRVQFSCATVIAGVAVVATEAVVSMVAVRDGVAAAGATTFAVTSAKRLRLTHLVVGMISTAAAVLSMRFALRTNPSGAAVVTSPIIAIFPVPSGAALAQAGGALVIPIPDGIEFSGTQQFALSQIGSVTTGTLWASLVGFEY